MALTNALYNAGAIGVPPGTQINPFNPTVNGPGQLGPALAQARATTMANLPSFPGATINPQAGPIGGATPYARMLSGPAPGIGASFPAATGASPTAVPGRLAGLTNTLRNPGNLLAGRATGWGAAARMGGYGALGTLGSSLIDRTNVGGQNSNWEQGLQGAAMGAGVGAGVGSVFPVVGTALGAGIGAIGGAGLGVLGNVFGWGDGDEPADPREQLDSYLSNVNLSTEAQRNIREQFEMEMMFAEESEDPDAARQLALASAQEGIRQYWATEAQAEEQAERAMAFQMAAQQYMAPRLSEMTRMQEAFSGYIEGIADTLPPEYQPIARLTAHQGRAATERTAAAYANQIATMGQTNAIQQYYGDVQNMAAQQLSAGIAQGVGGGQMNISDMLLQSQMAG